MSVITAAVASARDPQGSKRGPIMIPRLRKKTGKQRSREVERERLIHSPERGRDRGRDRGLDRRNRRGLEIEVDGREGRADIHHGRGRGRGRRNRRGLVIETDGREVDLEIEGRSGKCRGRDRRVGNRSDRGRNRREEMEVELRRRKRRVSARQVKMCISALSVIFLSRILSLCFKQSPMVKLKVFPLY